MKICIIIPTYNEEKNLGRLLLRIKRHNYDILVIDDGSEDKTGQIVKAAGVNLIKHNQRLGKGVSIRDGFNFCLKNNYEAVITMDGDGQHCPQDIPQFIAKAEEKKFDIIVGNRMGNAKGMPLSRLITNKVMSKIISFLCRQPIPDSQCGFRLINCEVLKGIYLDCCQFEIESEVLIEASKKGFRIGSVPILTIYGKEKSRINPFWDTLRFFRFILKKIWISQP